jgi:2-dehydro-3-deoxyphosphooctonate aldolase (KDO 8-P synthase)
LYLKIQGNKMIVFSGPCVIESREAVFKIAKELQFLQDDNNIDFYFKSSFDKANRTSIDSFRGPGLDEGLKILQEVKNEFGFKIITDIHESTQAQNASEVCDVLQIPAFLCRQTDLLVAAAKTKAKINIKKAQFLSGEAMVHPLKKVLQTRGVNELNYKASKKAGVWLCERGNMFGYSSLVVDMKNLVTMREYAPVIFDATHSSQIPSAGSSTKGNSFFAPILAKASCVVGVDGFFFESHTNPSIALSDGVNMLDIPTLKKTIKELSQLQKTINEFV